MLMSRLSGTRLTTSPFGMARVDSTPRLARLPFRPASNGGRRRSSARGVSDIRSGDA